MVLVDSSRSAYFFEMALQNISNPRAWNFSEELGWPVMNAMVVCADASIVAERNSRGMSLKNALFDGVLTHRFYFDEGGRARSFGLRGKAV